MKLSNLPLECLQLVSDFLDISTYRNLRKVSRYTDLLDPIDCLSASDFKIARASKSRKHIAVLSIEITDTIFAWMLEKGFVLDCIFVLETLPARISIQMKKEVLQYSSIANAHCNGSSKMIGRLFCLMLKNMLQIDLPNNILARAVYLDDTLLAAQILKYDLTSQRKDGILKSVAMGLNADMFKLLLSDPAGRFDPCISDARGEQLVHIIARFGSVGMMMILSRDYRVNIAARRMDGLMPIDLCSTGSEMHNLVSNLLNHL